MGKKHSKEKSAEKKTRNEVKQLKAKRRQIYSRCKFTIDKMHEHGKNYGFVSWLGYRKDDEEPVVLRANFITYGKVNYPILAQFISDLRKITNTYTKRMTIGSLNNDTPENIVRTMATVLWNQVQNNKPEPEIIE